MTVPSSRPPGSEPLAAGAYQYALLEDGTAEILRYTGDEARPAVPGVLGGRPVSRIGDEAFAA